LRADLRAVGLVYVSDDQPGIARHRHGKGFSYRDADGRRIGDKDELQRIRALAIPPAYEDVWICARPNGHLQATGYDARRRKQYRYHPHWRQLRDGGKFDRVIEFGTALPKLRRRVRHDLARQGLPQAKVLALLVRLLDDTLIRIGNDAYTRDNRSYGLTTLRSRHVRAQSGRLRFAFRGKSGQEREVELGDRRLAKIVRKIQQLPGQRLFQYIDDDGRRQPLDSGMVNDYLHGGGDEAAGFTAKDFRTWGGTVLACLMLRDFEACDSETQLKKNVVEAIKSVAHRLGNTPSVCRKCYVHPAVLESYLNGAITQFATGAATDSSSERRIAATHELRPEETALIQLLQQQIAAV
jgi:DNA topoisomerase IB